MGENFVIQVSAIGILVGAILIHLQWQKNQPKKVQIRSKAPKK